MPEETTTATAVMDAPAPDTTTGATISLDNDDDAFAPAQTAVAPDDSPAADAGDARSSQKADPEATEASDAFDATLLAYAKVLGFSEDEARAFGNNENLDRALSKHDKLLIARGRAGLAAQQGQAPPAQTTPPPQQTTHAQPAQQQAAPTIDFAAMEEELGAKATTVLKALHEQNTRLAAELKEYREGTSRRVDELDGWRGNINKMLEAQTRARDLHATAQVIEAMPDEWKALIGKIGDPTENPRIAEVCDTAILLLSRIRADSPDTKVSINDVVNRAYRSVFADKIEEIARAKIQKQLDQRKAQSAHPPTHRKAKEVADPVKRATNAVREKMVSMGFNPGLDD